MDPDYFSDVSDPLQGAPGTGVDQKTRLNAPSLPEDDLSNEFLTLLVQRYTDICYERRMLEEEIEDRLERKERTAVEKLRHVKIALETVRQKAVEIVAALNEASQGASRVNLPARSIRPPGSVPIFSGANGIHLSASGPIINRSPLPLVTGPNPVQAGERSIPNNASNQVPFAPSPASLHYHSLPLYTIRSTAIDHLSQPTLRRTPESTIPSATVPSFPSPTITPTQQDIYKKHDSMMIAAKAAGEGVSMLKIPWPLLMPHAHHYPMQNVMVQHLDDSGVISFFQGYIQWKGWNLKVEGRSLLTDWGQIFSQIPDHKRGGRQCVGKVVSILRGLLQN